MDKYVKARVGKSIGNGRESKREMVIGQIVQPVGKASWFVVFPGVGLTTTLSSKMLTLLSSTHMQRYASSIAQGAVATTHNAITGNVGVSGATSGAISADTSADTSVDTPAVAAVTPARKPNSQRNSSFPSSSSYGGPRMLVWRVRL